MTDEQTGSSVNDAPCSFDDDSVHIHYVSAVTVPRRFSETTGLEAFGAWLFTSHEYAALLVANGLPTDVENSGEVLADLISQVRDRSEGGDHDCGDWIELLQQTGDNYLAVSNEQSGAFVMDFKSAVDYVLANSDKYGLDSRANWHLI